MSFLIYHFYGVTEMVFDGLQKSSRIDFVTAITKENSFKFFGANNVEHRNTFDLRPEDLSNKALKRLHGKWCEEKAAYQFLFDQWQKS